MERHNVSILILIAVIAMAFPVLYSTHANEFSSSPVVYQGSALTEQSIAQDDSIQQSASVQGPWNIRIQEDVTPVEPVEEYVEIEENIEQESVQVETSATTETVVVAETIVVLEEVDVEPDADFAETIVLEIQRLTDRMRKRDNLRLFKDSSALTSIALARSTDMLTRDYFAHTTPDGCTLACRFENASYSASTWGENIATIEGENMPSAKEIAQAFFDQWMQSEGHRDNILSDEYTHQGVGVVREGDTIYVTVNFAKPI